MLEKLSFTERYVFHLLLDDMDLSIASGGAKISTLTNKEIAKILDMSERQVVRYVKKLQKLNYIEVSYIDNNKREITISRQLKERLKEI